MAKQKPYVSLCHGMWEVLNSRGVVVFSSRDYDTAISWWKAHF